MTGTTQEAPKRESLPGTEGTVSVVVNGAERSIPGGSSIANLLSSLSLDPRTVVVEHNGRILRDHASLPGVALTEGDVVEIVHFVGGG